MYYTCNLPEINIIVSIGNTRVEPSLYKRVSSNVSQHNDGCSGAPKHEWDVPEAQGTNILGAPTKFSHSIKNMKIKIEKKYCITSSRKRQCNLVN